MQRLGMARFRFRYSSCCGVHFGEHRMQQPAQQRQQHDGVPFHVQNRILVHQKCPVAGVGGQHHDERQRPAAVILQKHQQTGQIRQKEVPVMHVRQRERQQQYRGKKHHRQKLIGKTVPPLPAKVQKYQRRTAGKEQRRLAEGFHLHMTQQHPK